MKLFLITCLLGLLATSVFSAGNSIYDSGNKEPSEKELIEAGIKPGAEGESVDVDYTQYQSTPRSPDEIEGNTATDEAYDCEYTDENGRPEEPEQGEISQICEKGKEGVASESKESGLDVYSASCTRQPHPFTYYANKGTWKAQLKCCLKKWNYGCVHVKDRMPCFVNFNKNVREWCCPWWPQQTIARCVCDRCALMTNTCVHLGRCHKRYTKRSFFAVCYRYGWKYLRFFTRWVPSSCYCRIG